MALGVPVVSTPIGIEGIEASPGREAIVAEDVEVFAGAVVALLADADRRTQVVAAARRLVETHYDWDQIVARVETVYTELAGWSEDSQRTGRSPE
jgi:glycosyltransferase involved in cell wall biosynthesis